MNSMVIVMEISSADFTKLSLQQVADMLLDQEAKGCVCKGVVDGEMCNVYIRIEVGADCDE